MVRSKYLRQRYLQQGTQHCTGRKKTDVVVEKMQSVQTKRLTIQIVSIATIAMRLDKSKSSGIAHG